MPKSHDRSTSLVRAWQRFVAPLLVAVLVLALPSIALQLLGIPDGGSAVGLAGLAAMIATYVLGWRVGLGVAAAFAIGVPSCLAASGTWVLASAVMTIAAIAYGMTAARGWQRALALVPIAFGFAVADPPQSVLTITGLAAITAVNVLVALLAVGLVHLIMRGRHLGIQGKVSPSRAAGYAGMLAIAAALTAGIAVHGDWRHAGGWLIMTPFIVLQPSLKDALRKSLKRGIGTIAGFAIAFLLASVVSHGWAVYAIGVGFAVLALYALDRHWDYAAYATALTVAVVFIEGASTSIPQTSELRLIATVIGVVVSLIIMAIANPLYLRADRTTPAHPSQ